MARPQRLRRHRRTKIVATLGPASSAPEMIARLFAAGVDVFRLNLSHGSHDAHAAMLAAIRGVEARAGRPIGVLADVQGPKLRLARFAAGRVHLRAGQGFRLDLDPTPGDAARVQLPHPEIISAAKIGTTLLLDDGRVRLRVERQRPDHLECAVVVGGPLSDHKGVNLPGIALPIPALTAKDEEDLAFILPLGIDFIGLSFVQRPEDVLAAQAIAAGRAWILTKLEKPRALDNLDAILAHSDAVMVARGDLGVEMAPEEVPLAQKRIVRAARAAGRPVVVATQMLESMIGAPSPTRAEASDVATAVFDGADAVMLSAETAAGQYPLEAVSMMDRIIARVEQDAGWRQTIDASRPPLGATVSDAIAAAAGQVARSIDARAIAAFTAAGSSALRIARERPHVPVLGLTPERIIARRLAVVWGVHAMVEPETRTMEQSVRRAAEIARLEGFAAPGETVVVAAGIPFGLAESTNTLRVTVTR